MREFRRAVFRLLFTAVLLLFGAWAALKVMQYRGDVEAMLRDLQASRAFRFVREQVLPFVQEKAIPFFQEKAIPFFRDQVGPKLRGLTESAKEFLDSHVG